MGKEVRGGGKGRGEVRDMVRDMAVWAFSKEGVKGTKMGAVINCKFAGTSALYDKHKTTLHT